MFGFEICCVELALDFQIASQSKNCVAIYII